MTGGGHCPEVRQQIAHSPYNIRPTTSQMHLSPFFSSDLLANVNRRDPAVICCHVALLSSNPLCRQSVVLQVSNLVD